MWILALVLKALYSVTSTYDIVVLKVPYQFLNFYRTISTLQKPSVKYLGVHIDNKLKWKDHIKAVPSKVTRAIAMIRHTSRFIPKHTLKMLYQGLVEPHIRFCCSLWGACGITTRCSLEKLQNRAIKIATERPYDAPAEALLRQLGFPSIAEMIR